MPRKKKDKKRHFCNKKKLPKKLQAKATKKILKGDKVVNSGKKKGTLSCPVARLPAPKPTKPAGVQNSSPPHPQPVGTSFRRGEAGAESRMAPWVLGSSRWAPWSMSRQPGAGQRQPWPNKKRQCCSVRHRLGGGGGTRLGSLQKIHFWPLLANFQATFLEVCGIFTNV